jgi:hypothetical protein
MSTADAAVTHGSIRDWRALFSCGAFALRDIVAPHPNTIERHLSAAETRVYSRLRVNR